MADGRAIVGRNGKIILSAASVVGANAWSLTIGKDVVEVKTFEADWTRNLSGMKNWSGSLTAWQHQDDKLFMDCADADGPVAMFLYPDSDDLTNYWSGSAVFSNYAGSGATDAAVGGNVDFVGDSTLTTTGFA